ncbi:MAG: hypothetical protein HKN91_02365, partial [Acidimicrobiia bacterium]|nr:hypothetical protein [Acidimicrobiia bacterium]
MPIKRSPKAGRAPALLIGALFLLAIPNVAMAMPPDPGGVSGNSGLNPWSIDGALFATDAEG